MLTVTDRPSGGRLRGGADGLLFRGPSAVGGFSAVGLLRLEVGSSFAAAHAERRTVNNPAQCLQVLERVFRRDAAENYSELFASAAKRLASTRHFRNARRHHAQNLVADVVPVGIVKVLEMIDVNYGNCVLLVERKQSFVEGATPADAGKFIIVGEHIRSLNQRSRDD